MVKEPSGNMRLEIGIIALVEEVLGVPAERRAQFDWLINKPSPAHFGEYYPRIADLFEKMGGDWDGLSTKGDGYLTPDAYFPAPYNFIFEFDELQHFTVFRQTTLEGYPKGLALGFDRQAYRQLCLKHQEMAIQKGTDRFRRKTADFPFINGRAAQRAFFDTFRDWLPPLHGLNPTVRLAEFEVTDILSGALIEDAAKDRMRSLIEQRLL